MKKCPVEFSLTARLGHACRYGEAFHWSRKQGGPCFLRGVVGIIRCRSSRICGFMHCHCFGVLIVSVQLLLLLPRRRMWQKISHQSNTVRRPVGVAKDTALAESPATMQFFCCVLGKRKCSACRRLGYDEIRNKNNSPIYHYSRRSVWMTTSLMWTSLTASALLIIGELISVHHLLLAAVKMIVQYNTLCALMQSLNQCSW